MTTYRNIDERYGNPELATLADYSEVNPAGIFIEFDDGIYEKPHTGVTWIMVAEVVEPAVESDEPEPTMPKEDLPLYPQAIADLTNMTVPELIYLIRKAAETLELKVDVASPQNP